MGAPGVPWDAVVAELSGPAEVFLGETVPLSVRIVSPAPEGTDWDLVLTREGKELDRRTVQGNGQWQYANFAFPSTNSGINLYQARLELARDSKASELR